MKIQFINPKPKMHGWLVGWLWIKRHIRLGPRYGTLTLFQATANRRICGELRCLHNRRPPGNRTRVANAEARMHASAPTAPQAHQTMTRVTFEAEIIFA